MAYYDIDTDFTGSFTARMANAISTINSTDETYIHMPPSSSWNALEDELDPITGSFFTIRGSGMATRINHSANTCSVFKVANGATLGEISGFYMRQTGNLTSASANHYSIDIQDGSNITCGDIYLHKCAGAVRLGADDANSAISAARCTVRNIIAVTDQGHTTDGVLRIGNATDAKLFHLNFSGGLASDSGRTGSNFKIQPQGGLFTDTVRMTDCDFQCRDSEDGLSSDLDIDRKPVGAHFNTELGKIVNVWLTNVVLDHTKEKAVWFEIPDNEMTGIHFNHVRSSAYGDGYVIEHSSDSDSREISFMKSHMIWVAPDTNAVKIINKGTGRFVDCDLDYMRVSETSAENKKIAMDFRLCTGGWSVTNSKLKPRNTTQPKKTRIGLRTRKTITDFTTNNNDFSWAYVP